MTAGSAVEGEGNVPLLLHLPARASMAVRPAELASVAKIFAPVVRPAPVNPLNPSIMQYAEVVKDVKDSPRMAGVGRMGDGLACLSGWNVAPNLDSGAWQVVDKMSKQTSTHKSASAMPQMVVGRPVVASAALIWRLGFQSS